jgi:N-acetylglucosamine kinase-like BadF-type ATPase
LVRRHFGVKDDLDLCARIYGPPALSRSELAALSRLATEAALSGDLAARRIFDSAAQELAALVHAVRDGLRVAPEFRVATSYCGGLLEGDGPLRSRFEQALQESGQAYDVKPPRLRPAAGAAVAAARLARAPLSPTAVQRLEQSRVQAYVP